MCECLFAHCRLHTQTHTYALGATSGASDYAVKPNQFPVFGLMDAIIFTDLKQVSMPPPPLRLNTTTTQADIHL